MGFRCVETNRNESLEQLYGRQRVGGFKFPRETQHLFLAYSLWVPFFWENSKRICDLRLYGFFTTKQKGRSEKGSFTMNNGISPCSSWKKQQQQQQQQQKRNNNNKLILTVKIRRKSNISYKWIYQMYIFRFETHERFSNRIHSLGQ